MRVEAEKARVWILEAANMTAVLIEQKGVSWGNKERKIVVMRMELGSCVVFSGRKVTMDEYGSRIGRRDCWESNPPANRGPGHMGGFCSAFRVNGGVWLDVQGRLSLWGKVIKLRHDLLERTNTSYESSRTFCIASPDNVDSTLAFELALRAVS